MKVPFLELTQIHYQIKDKLIESFLNVLDSGQYISGDKLYEFEKNYSNYCGANYAVGVGNGLDAITVGLKALGIYPGDEVIVPANTFIATWLGVNSCGAIPIPIEPEFSSFNIDPNKIEERITKKTKAIIPVHLFGKPANLTEITKIAKKYTLSILEDAAQAHGATYRGRPIGGHGNLVAWSFYPGKNLGAIGDAGAVTCNDSEIASLMRAYGNYGSSQKYISNELGINSRLDSLQASILSLKLNYLSMWNDRRRNIAKKYIEGISCPGLILPESANLQDQVWHLFVVRHPNRDRLRSWLLDREIECGIHYPIPPHLQGAFDFLGYRPGSFPITELMAETMLSLPMGPHLSDEQVDFVIASVNKFRG